MSDMVIPEGWSKDILTSFVELKHGYQFRTPDFSDSGVRVVKIGQVLGGGQLGLSSCDFVREEFITEKKSFLLKTGDVLMSLTGNIGRVGVVPTINFPLLQNYRVGLFLPKEGKCNRNFMPHLLESEIIVSQIETNSNSTAQSNFGKSDLDKVIVQVPPLPEQKKIASILTSVDDVIEKTQSQINKLQDLKKGTMNELLTRGIGHTEFKDSAVGQIPKEWEVRICDDVCKKIGVGIATSTTHAYTDHNGVVILRNQNIKEGTIDATNLLYITHEFSEQNSTKKLKKGDVVSARTGYPGVSAVVSEEFVGCHSFTTLISSPKEDLMLSAFYALFFNSQLGQNIVKKTQAGGAQQNLNVEMMKLIAIPVPSLLEQQKIATILSSIDNNIEEKQRKLNQTKSLKKSLMQDLLTGKVRVTIN